MYDQGVSMLVKSFNKERMTQNLQIFDWELTEEDYKKINQMPQNSGLREGGGLFKTLVEFLDEEA